MKFFTRLLLFTSVCFSQNNDFGLWIFKDQDLRIDHLNPKSLFKDFLIKKKDTIIINISLDELLYDNKTKRLFNLESETWNKNFFINVHAQVYKGDHRQHEIGAEYQRHGVSAKFKSSFIKYYGNSFGLVLGRSPIRWGANRNESIILAGNNSGIDNIYFRIDYKNYGIDFFQGNLNSGFDEQNKKIQRRISGHKFLLALNEKLHFNFGELIIFTGENKGYDLTYINPFIPYFLSALNGEQKDGDGDNYNSMIFMYFKYKPKPNLQFFYEFLIDDFQLDNTGVGHKLGHNIGFISKYNILNIPFILSLSASKLDSNVYLHNGDFTDWNNKYYSLGHSYGPHKSSVKLIFKTQFIDKLNLYFDFTYFEKDDRFYQRYDLVQNDVLEYQNSTLYFSQLHFFKKFKNIQIRAGWHDKVNPYEIANGDYFLKGNKNEKYYFLNYEYFFKN